MQRLFRRLIYFCAGAVSEHFFYYYDLKKNIRLTALVLSIFIDRQTDMLILFSNGILNPLFTAYS